MPDPIEFMPDENAVEVIEKASAPPAAPEKYDASKIDKLEGLEACLLYTSDAADE